VISIGLVLLLAGLALVLVGVLTVKDAPQSNVQDTDRRYWRTDSGEITFAHHGVVPRLMMFVRMRCAPVIDTGNQSWDDSPAPDFRYLKVAGHSLQTCRCGIDVGFLHTHNLGHRLYFTRKDDVADLNIVSSESLTERVFNRLQSTGKPAEKPKRPGTARDHDFMTVARRVVEQAIGEQIDGSPLPDKDASKNPAAVALGKLGGAKGGRARADSLSRRRRIEIAKQAAKARWEK